MNAPFTPRSGASAASPALPRIVRNMAPLPGRPPHYPFDELDVGDAIVCPCDMGLTKDGRSARRNTMAASASRWMRKPENTGRKITIGTSPDLPGHIVARRDT